MMAQKNKKQVKQDKAWKNPAQRAWGKIIIAILAIFMACGSLISLIWLMIEYGSKV